MYISTYIYLYIYVLFILAAGLDPHFFSWGSPAVNDGQGGTSLGYCHWQQKGTRMLEGCFLCMKWSVLLKS